MPIGVWGIIVTMAASWYLAGLSWTVLLVVYPAFSHVGANEWRTYHEAHSRGIVPAVGVMWFAEAVGMLMWLAARPPGTGSLLIVCAIGVVATVAVTAVAAVPAHAALAAGYDRFVWQRLQRAHALRTAAWTVAALAATTAVLTRLG